MEISNGLTYELIPVEDAIGALLDGMEVFGRLYDIEREHKAYAPEVRLKARQERAKPIWEEFGRWLEDQVGLLASGSAIHKAFAYTMRRFKRLGRYMDDPMVEIDSNLVEREIRPAALGRRNFMFCGSDEGARRVALLYSLIGTCRLHGINPVTWMTDVLRKIQTHPKDRLAGLLPHRWKELNPELSANQGHRTTHTQEEKADGVNRNGPRWSEGSRRPTCTSP